MSAPTTPNEPKLRSINLISGQLNKIAPLAGYRGCVVLVPKGAQGGGREVAMYVDSCLLPDGVMWDPPNSPDVAVIDVPVGFDIRSGAAYEALLKDSDGKPPPGGVAGHP